MEMHYLRVTHQKTGVIRRISVKYGGEIQDNNKLCLLDEALDGSGALKLTLRLRCSGRGAYPGVTEEGKVNNRQIQIFICFEI